MIIKEGQSWSTSVLPNLQVFPQEQATHQRIQQVSLGCPLAAIVVFLQGRRFYELVEEKADQGTEKEVIPVAANEENPMIYRKYNPII